MCKVTINENGLNVEGGEIKVFEPTGIEVGTNLKACIESKINGNPIPKHLRNFAKSMNI